MTRRVKIFTWNTGSDYLYYLSHIDADFYFPVDYTKGAGYLGRSTFPFGDNVIEVKPQDVRHLKFDAILFQSRQNYLIDQHVLFSPDQHIIPKLYLEHNPPHLTPASSSHIVDDPDMIVVHVSHFNKLMWDNNHTPSYVIEHAVADNDVQYTGEVERGIVVLHQPQYERESGLDILRLVGKKIPIDIIGPHSESMGGLGHVPLADLPEFLARYRFYFDPTRYASPAFSTLNAMMAGMPVVGLATGAFPMMVTNGVSGLFSSDIKMLTDEMYRLMEDPDYARRIGSHARDAALSRFELARFITDWNTLFQKAASRSYPPGYFAEILKNVS